MFKLPETDQLSDYISCYNVSCVKWFWMIKMYCHFCVSFNWYNQNFFRLILMITCIEYIHPVAVDKYHCPFAFFIILWIIFQSKHHFNGPINCSLCSQKPFPLPSCYFQCERNKCSQVKGCCSTRAISISSQIRWLVYRSHTVIIVPPLISCRIPFHPHVS